MNVGGKKWMRNFKLSRTIIHFVVPCPSNVKVIGCKWVYSIKLYSDGTLDRYKAQLVAHGNRQEYRVDYE